jgi:hypothetical protein
MIEFYDTIVQNDSFKLFTQSGENEQNNIELS